MRRPKRSKRFIPGGRANPHPPAKFANAPDVTRELRAIRNHVAKGAKQLELI